MANQIYKYKLTLGNTISGACKELTLIEGVDKVFSDKENSYNLKLLGIKINRKIYQPCEIEAELDFSQTTKNSDGTTETTPPEFSDVSALLLKRIVKLEMVQVENTTNDVTLGKAFTIAENYYVFEINPQLKRDTTGIKMYVRLNIFSMDKLMTLNKYSKAYVARKLGSSILATESRLFGLQADQNTPLIVTNTDSIRFLKYNDSYVFENQLTANIPSEFIQPYLVQYNETFYDFLVRTSNRCGEFLFFENGQLIMGLPDSGEPVEIGDFEAVTMKDISPETITVGNYARDSMKDSPKLEEGLNQTPIERESTGFPDDIFPESTMSNAELANDEYLFPLYKDKFTDLKREMGYDGDAGEVAMSRAFPFLETLLSNEVDSWAGVGASVAKAAIVGEGIKNGLAFKQGLTFNKEKAAHHITPFKKKSEQCNDEEVVQFGSLNRDGWTTIDYYNDIHKYETQMQKQTICINMGTRIVDVKLGQKIKVKGLKDTYVVIQIKQNSEEKWDRDYDLYDGKDSNQRGGMRSLKIYAIPALKGDNNEEQFYPPVQPVPIIRKVGPQTAFVTDNDDPKFQGRVRIVYPWQSLKSEMKAQLTACETMLKEDVENSEKLKKQKDELGKKVAKWDDLINDINHYCDNTEEGREAHMADKLGEISKLEAEIAQLKKEEDLLKPQYQKLLNNKNKLLAAFNMKNRLDMLTKKIAAKQAEVEEKRKHVEALKEAYKHVCENKGKENYNWATDNPTIKAYEDTYNDYCEQYKEVGVKLKRTENDIASRKQTAEECKTFVETDIKKMASPWVRIASPMATPGGGAFFKPRVGDEVLVNYDNDNVERPYVVGSLFSKNNITPEDEYYRKTAAQLQQKDISMSLTSPNGHHITFTDPKGGASFITNAISPGLGFYGSIFLPKSLGEGFKDLTGGIHIGDRYGLYEVEMNSHKRSIDISSPFGTVSIDAFSGISISAPNGDIEIKGKNITLEAGNTINLLSGKNISDPGLGDGGKGNKVIGVIGKITNSVVSEFVSSVVDLSLIRHVVEVFVRPVDGTTCIKSKRYLMLEAGEGNATIRHDRYAQDESESENKSQRFFGVMLKCVDYLDKHAEGFFNTYNTYWTDARKNYIAYTEKAGKLLKEPSKISIFETIASHEEWDDNIVTMALFENNFKDISQDNQKLLEPATKFAKAALKLKNHRAKLFDYINAKDITISDDQEFGLLQTSLAGADMEKICKDKAEEFVFNKENEELFNQETGKVEKDCFSLCNKTLVKRQLVMRFIKSAGDMAINDGKFMSTGFNMDSILSNKDLSKEYYWKRQVSVLDRDRKLQHIFIRTLWDNSFKNFLDQAKSNFAPFDRDIWNDKKSGQILFSDQEDSTLNFEGEGVHRETGSNIGTMDHLKKVLMGIH